MKKVVAEIMAWIAIAGIVAVVASLYVLACQLTHGAARLLCIGMLTFIFGCVAVKVIEEAD